MRALLAVLLLVGCGLGCGDRAPALAPVRGPNVLLIVLDTTRADFLSCYGFAGPTTPRIDALAAAGTRFDAAFSTSYWTLPAHASLFTGLYPSAVRATETTGQLPEAATTIAERLRSRGYRTYGASANPWIAVERGFGQGFEEYIEAWRETEARPAGPPVAEAVSWIERSVAANEPFFVFLNFNTAHMPYRSGGEYHSLFLAPDRAPQRVRELSEIRGLWPFLAGRLRLGAADFELMRELYASEIRLVDDYVGQVADALERHGVLDDTLIIITSDHGENFGEHGLIDHSLSMYDTTVRIPLILRYPARVGAGKVVTDLVSINDVAPTIADVCGLGQDGEREQLSEASLCGVNRRGRRFVIAENDRPLNGIEVLRKYFPDFDVATIDAPVRMVRTETHKLIWHVGLRSEVYGLADDPGETHSLAAEAPALEAELREHLEQWRLRLEAVAADHAAPGIDSESLEALRSLGYIQ